MLTTYGVIPARLASTRLPRKMLLAETGKPLVQHTYESARRASRLGGLCVATDHEAIAAAVRAFGGTAAMTSAACQSGSDRVAEVARNLPEVDVLVNIQGDEPEVSAAAIDVAIGLLEANPTAEMSTVAAPLRTRRQLDDPACVKVVLDHAGAALYFSRSPIPHPRDWSDALLAAEPPLFYQHMGLYAYRRAALLRLAELPASPLEQTEKLEQLRALQAGWTILVGVVDTPTTGIDTPDDYAAFVARWRAAQPAPG